MSMIRTVKQENPFVQIDKYVLNDERISWEAKGLMSYILSKPDGWTIRKTDLIKKSKSGKTRVESALLELMSCGYLNWYQLKDEDGKFGDWIYNVYERPEFNPELEKCSLEGKERIEKRKKRNKKRNDSSFSPKVDNPLSDNPLSDNQPFSNNDNNNNDNNNNDLGLKKEEEEENIYNIGENDVVYEILKDELKDKEVSDKTIRRIVNLLMSKKITDFQIDDLENQCRHMCDMIDNNKRIYDFAEYFVNGIEQMIENKNVNSKYQSTKQPINANTEVLFNWLAED